MDPKAVLLMTLVIVTQLAKTRSLSTAPNQSTHSNDSEKSPSLYVFGAFDEQYNILDSVSRLKNGEWTTMNDMPMGRRHFCGTVIDKQIYLFGGQTNNETHYRYWNSTEVYDSFTDTYTFLQSMPDQRGECAAAALNNAVYVVGGFIQYINGNGASSSRKLLRYDIGTNQWSTLAEMSWPRYGHQLVELDGLLYAIGTYPATEAYNSTTDRWSSLADTNVWHRYSGAVAHQGEIYVLSSNGFERYSPWLNKWTVLDVPAIVKNAGRSLVSMDGKLWAIGGEIASDVTKGNTVYTYDPVTARWTKQRDMDVPRKNHRAFVVNH